MTAVVIGVGPGLGMSIAHRFGREGHPVALISRRDTRHPDYLAELSAAGIKAEAFVADVFDPVRLRSTLDDAVDRLGPAEVVYYGPASIDFPGPRSRRPPPTTSAPPWPISMPLSTSSSTCCRAC